MSQNGSTYVRATMSAIGAGADSPPTARYFALRPISDIVASTHLNHLDNDGFDCRSNRLFHPPHSFLRWRAFAHATTCGVNKNNRPASSIVISPFEQRLRAAAQCFCCNHKAARFAFECLHLTSIGARPCSHKLHSLGAARASHVLAVTHWNMSPSCKPRA